MKKSHSLAVSVAIALASVAAHAQTAVPATEGSKPHMSLDANKDGVIDRAEAAKAPRLAGMFDQLDENKDGKLAAEERPHMRRAMRHRGGMRRGGHERMMAVDADKDGRISRAEAQAAQAKHAGRFDEMDVNKDGYLDRTDRQARVAQRRGECFAKADADKNGQLSRAEFDKMREVCGAKR